ncbi:MAG: polysaccharide biosynthesis/export family protein, partial [Desulfosarcina sp.]|nr:polysaccharide biosynthesis/export family protein [Desulfosarcina sp.]
MNDARQTNPMHASFVHALGSTLLPVLSLLIGIFLLGACASTDNAVTNRPAEEPQLVDYSLGEDEISRMNEMILSQAQTNNNPGDYLLGEGDLLRISVFEAKELDTTVRVSSRGLVTLPLIETVDVKGLTAIEAEEKIEAIYQQRYIKNPHVSIFVEEHISQRITLVGQFKNPGTYDYPTKQRLLDTIALGGGLSEKAGQMVQIRKSRRSQGQPEVVMIDLDQLINKGNVQQNIEINGGDVLFIPEAGVFFVDGAVKRPGAYAIKHRTVVQEALVEAGGIEPWAVKDKIKLLRLADNGEREIIDLDLGQTSVKEMAVKDRDILIVDESGVAGF